VKIMHRSANEQHISERRAVGQKYQRFNEAGASERSVLSTVPQNESMENGFSRIEQPELRNVPLISPSRAFDTVNTMRPASSLRFSSIQRYSPVAESSPGIFISATMPSTVSRLKMSRASCTDRAARTVTPRARRISCSSCNTASSWSKSAPVRAAETFKGEDDSFWGKSETLRIGKAIANVAPRGGELRT